MSNSRYGLVVSCDGDIVRFRDPSKASAAETAESAAAQMQHAKRCIRLLQQWLERE
jgi:hypothetical protein